MQYRKLTRVLLADLFVFGILHGIMAFMTHLLVPGVNHFLTALVLITPFFAMTAVRCKVESLSVFIGMHFALCTWPMWLNIHPATQYFMVMALLFAALYSLAMRVGGGWWPSRGLTIAAASISASVMIMANYIRLPTPDRVLFIWALVMVLCHLICYQIVHVDSSLEILQGTVRQPVETTWRFNNFILALFLVPVTVLGAASIRLPLDKLGRKLMDALILFYIWINNLLYRLLMGAEQAPQEELTPVRPDLSEMLPKAAEAPAWLRILEKVFYYAVQLIVLVLLVRAAIYGLRVLYRLFYSGRQQGGDVREYIGPMIDPQDWKRRAREWRRRGILFGMSEQERVRRAYYRKVKRHIRRGAAVHPADTTGEIAEHLRPREDLEELTKQYNQARYDLHHKKK